MSAAVALAKSWLIGKSALVSALVSGTFGILSETLGLVSDNGSRVIFIALCALAGAFVGSIHRIMGAWFTHKASEREFVGKEIRGLIDILKKSAADNEKIIAVDTSIRHDIQSAYQAAIWHINLLDGILKDKGVKDVPSIAILDVALLLRQRDKSIMAIKSIPGDPGKETKKITLP